MGSIPFGYLLTKIFLKKDIRDIGSGNIGATNALRTGNKLIGFSTLSLDIIKAVLPVIFIKFNYPEYIYVSSLSVFIGHVFPLWLKFKGGKGIATYLGIVLALSLKLGLIFCLSWIIIVLITKYSSLSSIISALVIFLISFFESNLELNFFLFSTFVIIIYTHRQNIIRLKNKTEDKIKL